MHREKYKRVELSVGNGCIEAWVNISNSKVFAGIDYICMKVPTGVEFIT